MTAPSVAAPLRVLVAVHGIGDQTEYATLQQLVNLCLGRTALPKGVPIGKLHSKLRPPPPALAPAWAELQPLPGFGFAEVFWADLGREREEYLLEDTVRWADTIVQRLEVIDDQVERITGGGKPIDRLGVQRVLRDVALCVQLARLLNRGLTFLGLGSVELDKMLIRYLGDVQLFAEFAGARAAIMARFHAVMQRIDAEAAGRPVEIHLCAHSQGSVLAFLGLLEARAWGSPWLDRVRTFMTIGSPIDKFLILWPELFQPFTGLGTDRARRIAWWNHADRGDPVGYELDTAKAYCRLVDPELFAEGTPKERLFRRYLIPGKAHVDYWNDQELFDEWLRDGVGHGGPARAAGDRWLVRLLAPLVLFLLPAAFAGGAAYAICSAIKAIVPEVTFGMTGCACVAVLILGTVALAEARNPSKRWYWTVLGFGLFALGAWLVLSRFDQPVAWMAITILFTGALVQLALDWLRSKR